MNYTSEECFDFLSYDGVAARYRHQQKLSGASKKSVMSRPCKFQPAGAISQFNAMNMVRSGCLADVLVMRRGVGSRLAIATGCHQRGHRLTNSGLSPRRFAIASARFSTPSNRDHVLRNRSDGRFDVICSTSGFAEVRPTRAAVWVDYD